VAIVSLIVLLVALGIAALINSQPWAPSSVSPRVGVAPGLEVALGDAVAVSHGRQLAVAPAAPAAGGKARMVVDRVGGGGGENAPQLGIGPARVAKAPQPVATPEGAPAPHASEPLPAPGTAPASAPEAVPVAAPAPPPAAEPVPAAPGRVAGGEGGPQGPIAGGAGEGALTEVQVCEGDEYTLSFSRSETGVLGEPVPAPPAAAAPHQAVVYFGSSSEGAAFYLAFLDGRLIGMGESVESDSGSECAPIDSELLDLGEEVEGSYEIRFEGIPLGEPGEPALP
jgi:hypothetical protein